MLGSDVEFEDENITVGNYVIKNYRNPRDCIAKGVEIPEPFRKKMFKPSAVSLNNKVVFMATGTGSSPHSGEKKGCGLTPGCGIFWANKTSRISKVHILSGNHPEVGKEVWSCFHHSQASIGGFQLQTQTLVPRFKTARKEERKTAAVEDDADEVLDSSSTSKKTTKTTPEKSSSKKEKVQAKLAKQNSKENLVEEFATETDGAKSEVPNNFGGEVTKKRNRLSLRKKTRGDVEEK